MRLLPILLLVRCFSCVLLKIFANEIIFEKLYALGSKENTIKFNSTVRINNIIHKGMHDTEEGGFFSIELNCVSRNQTFAKEKIVLCSVAFNNKKCRHVKFGQLVTQWNGKEFDRSLFYDKCSTNNRRKLLSYSDKAVYANSMKSEQLHKINTQLDETEQKDSLKNIENFAENQKELWDDWGNWSTCSVTCGNGRQVRWRHCSAEHCMKGLKKAQIKSCRLKNCDSKNILHWLGIKSR